ncbi:MAG: TraB/GumN family protein [Saprospiraceae bacterium]
MNKYQTLLTLIFTILFFSPTAKSQSLLWEISGNGLEESSYLFGTIHISDKRVFNFNDSVFAKIDECDAFAMEIESTPENTKEIGNSIFLEDGKTIDKMLSEKDYAYLTKFFKETFDLNLDGLKFLTPMTIISMATMKLFKSDMETSVDNYLYKYAKSKNKKTFSVEPLQLQIDLLKNVPAEYLLDVANEWENFNGISEKLVNAYAKEDLEDLIETIFSDSGFKKMEDEFIWDRNKTMTDSIDLFVNRQSTFIAIGTAHLPLEGGVIDLLRKKGYEVKPIIAPKTKALPEIKTNWITVAPEGTGFSVEMPKQPEFQEFDKASDVGNLSLKFYIAEMSNEAENLAYGIAITDYPFEKINSETMTKSELDDYYEKSLQGTAKGVKGKIIKRGEIKLDSFIAKTVDINAYDGLAIIKYAILLRNNRLFLLQVMTKGNTEKNTDLDKFFNSFKLEDYDLNESTSNNVPSKEWETIISEEGNFSISMLGKTVGRRHTANGEAPKNSDPLYYVSENIDRQGKEFVQYIIFIDFENGINADSMSKEEVVEFYNDNLTSSLKNLKGEVTSKKELMIEKHLAQKSVAIISEDGIDMNLVAIRLLNKNRFYYIQFISEKEAILENEMSNFLNSFKILKE